MRLRVLSAAGLCGLSFFGCSTEKREIPVGCREGETAVREALRAAPGEVRVQGARLSECFNDTIDGGDLSNIGIAYLETAADLARVADRNPEGRAAVQLGYLIGALRGAASGSQGITVELERRIEQEAVGLERGSAAFERGLRAGRRSG